MERWVNDNIPIAGETFREFVKNLYQGNELVRGETCLDKRRVELSRIECPLLLLTAENDHLVAPPSTERILPHVSSRDVKAMRIDAGHVGLVVSSKAHKTFWPDAARWLARRCVQRQLETGAQAG
jgi:polyhydroxyalkanoate synthase